MVSLILDKFHEPYNRFRADLRKNKSIYLHANDKESRLEVSPLKKSSLCEVFQKAQVYLQEDIQAASTISEIEKQIECLGYLLKDGRALILYYSKKNNTWCRKLLKFIHAQAPKILKNYFPRIFSNQVEEIEQKTQKAYQQYSCCIQELQKQLTNIQAKLKEEESQLFLNLEKAVQLKKQLKAIQTESKEEAQSPLKDAKAVQKPVEPSKNIDCLPNDIIQKILQDGLFTKERASALTVCKRWNSQLAKAADRESLTIKTYVESIIASLNDEKFAPIIEKLKAILSTKEISGAALMVADRQKNVQKNIYLIFNEYHLLLNNHIEIVKAAISFSSLALKFASSELKNSFEIVKMAVAQKGCVLVDASAELKNNLEIVKMALAQDGRALAYASAELRNNAEIVKMAVAQDGRALAYALGELNGNIEIVKIAVAQSGYALAYALADLRNNAEIVKIAVAQDGRALQYASNELRSNAEIVKIAVAQDGRALRYVLGVLKA